MRIEAEVYPPSAAPEATRVDPYIESASLAETQRTLSSFLYRERIKRSLCELRGQTISGIGSQVSGCRSVGQLIARADAIAEERQEKEAQQRARMKARREREEAEKRKKHLESLVGKESDLWARVEKSNNIP